MRSTGESSTAENMTWGNPPTVRGLNAKALLRVCDAPLACVAVGFPQTVEIKNNG